MPYNLYNRAGILIPPAVKGFLFGSRTIITATGGNSYSAPRYAKYLFFQYQGAGGGGKNCANSSANQIVLGGGGSSGGFVELYMPALPGVWTVTIGVGGSGASGAAGGTTTILSPTTNSSGLGNYIVATVSGGGGGGTLATGTSQAMIAPVTGSGSSGLVGIGINGWTSYESFRNSGTLARSGRGADSYFGVGGIARITHGVGNAGLGYGSGGGGGMSVNAGGAVAGGSGANGICIISEYY